MPDPSPDIDYMDYTLVSFPSDRLTFADLRRTHPDLFDVDDPPAFDHPRVAAVLTDLIHVERLLARHAYEVAIGKPIDLLRSRHLPMDDCLDELTAGYVRYGLASGRHHVEQLVRAFQAQAAAQAAGRHGRGT